MLYVYDIESYPNAFTVTIVRVIDMALWRFEITDRAHQGVEFFTFLMSLRDSGGRMVGFNNLGYDYPVLHQIILRGGHMTAAEIYTVSMGIINTPWEDRFSNVIYDSDIFVKQIDLMKIHHFDNVARATSLKMLENNMRSKNVQDLPIPVGTFLTLEQLPILITYNDHDVFETIQFLSHSMEKLNFRDELSARYGKDFTNFNDTKIGKEFFIMELEKHGVNCFDRSSGRKKPIQTHHLNGIDLNTVILPWLKFDQPEFQRVTNWLRSQTIHSTKGVFESINIPFDMAMTSDPSKVKVFGLTPDCVPSFTPNARQQHKLDKGVKLSLCLKHIDLWRHLPNIQFISGQKKVGGLNCIINGFQYDFGTGGIHGSIESTIVRTDDTHIIIDLDVASYYPNIAISNGFFPAHLGAEFCRIYLEIYNQRKDAKAAKQEAIQAMLKLALNGVYGDSNNPHSPFYDPAYTMAITINGQLMLCKLAEMLTTAIPDLSMVQINTDGLTVRCPREAVDTLTFLSDTWEQMTGLDLERNDYSVMAIRDVNSYIAVGADDGKVKRKGAYGYGKDLGWHQNHSTQVVAKAAEAAILHAVPVVDTIMISTDPYDFLACTKVPRNSHLMLGGHQVQNITRFYVSTDGGELNKMMPPTPAQLAKDPAAPFRRMGVKVGCLVTEANDLTRGAALRNINHQYYIDEANKLVEPLQ